MMQWAALVTWLLTALGGLVLLFQWVRHGGLQQREGIRAARLFSHLLLAVTGLIVWIAYLVTDNQTTAWAAVAILAAVALLGASMFLISARGRTRTARTETPAEAMFPLPVVVGHGLLATTTLILALLSAAGI
jgi:hypothetical protein